MISDNRTKSQSEIEDDCRKFMSEMGIPLQGAFIADGKPKRYSADQNPKKEDEWYVCFQGVSGSGIPYINTVFGSWSTGERYYFNSFERYKEKLLPTQLRELRQRWKSQNEEVQRDLKVLHDEAAEKAKAIWENASELVSDEAASAYTVLKGIKPFGARYCNNSKGYPCMVIPIKNGAGDIRSLQFFSVGKDGTKYKAFMPKGEVKENFYTIGAIKTDQPLYVVEGYATGCSIHEATDCATVVAFTCHNLEAVVSQIRKLYPNNWVIVAGDDDVETKENPGRSEATAAAEKHGCSVVFPVFDSKVKLPSGKSPTDFNDVHALFGIEALRIQLSSGKKEVWPDPKPIKAELLPVMAFDANALLPQELKDFVMDESDRMPCPPDFVAAAVLVALGSAIGAQCAIRPKSRDNWIIVPNLWGGVVGLPSAKKSPAIDAAFKPFERIIAEAREKQAAAEADYEDQKILYQAKKDAVEFRIKSAAKGSMSKKPSENPEKVIEELRELRQKSPEPPIPRRFKSNDTTVEKLGELLRDNPAGLLILRDELVGLLSTWDRSGHEGDRTFYLESWMGSSGFDTDRIGRGSIYIPNLCTSIFGGIQPDKLTQYLDQTENSLANDGLLQRFQVLVYPDPIKWEWRDRAPSLSARDQVFKIFSNLTSEQFDPTAYGALSKEEAQSKFPCFSFNDESQLLFIEWCTALHKREELEDNPLIKQHLCKYEKLFPAICLIFHLVDCSLGNIAGGKIAISSAIRAAAWCEYLESHARRCYGLLADSGLRAAQSLSQKITKGKLSNDFTARNVRRNQWRYLTSEDAVESALDWLEEEGWVKSYETGGTGPGSGRRTTRYRINPKILGSNNPVNQEGEQPL